MSSLLLSRVLPAALMLALLGVLASQAGTWPAGRTLVFTLGLGVAFGVVLQRTRFCFYCHVRDYLERGDSRGVLAILLALSVGTVGMHLMLGSWLPVPVEGRLPPDAHIGPVSWALVLAGLAFGLGKVVSGSCISAHWYRLGEGSPTAPFALIGSALGFVLGFNTWNPLYSATVAEAKPWWLPHALGYGGSATVTLLIVGGLALWVWRRGVKQAAALAAPVVDLKDLATRLFSPSRWPYWVGGVAVAWLSTLILLRTKPLGVTAALGSAARQAGTSVGWVPARLEGLDELGGCATAVPGPWWQTPNALLIAGLVGGSFAAALLSRQFQPTLPKPAQVLRGLGGGVLLGWGAMTGLGCTVGNLLSGTMAGAVSGWVFGVSVFVAVWVGLRLKWAA
ncbi:MAG: YeeE/YedE family protein [Rhizobacter sp.]